MTRASSSTDAACKVARGHVGLSAVVPIDVIVVLAIACVIVAVLSAAQRADETAGVALAGFVLLAARIFGHMRTTAATIAAGEKKLRHLALHDPLCGLPNRIFFGERLEAVIEKVQKGGGTAAVF